MNFILAVLFVIMLIFFLRFFFRHTILDLSFFKNIPFIILWYYDLCQVIIPLLLIGYLGIDNIPLFFIAKSGIELDVMILVVISLLFYFISFSFFLKFFHLTKSLVKLPGQVLNSAKLDIICKSLVLFGILMLSVFYVLGYKHAYLTSLFNQVLVLKIRLANVYTSKVPTQISSMLPLCGYLLALFSGKFSKFNFLGSIFYFLLAEFFLTASGNKSFPMMGFILWFLSVNFPFKRKFFTLKNLLTVLLIFVIFISLLFFVVSRQIPDLTVDLFVMYLFNRIGVGQMVGLYESYMLVVNKYPIEGNFYLHAIPFAKLLVNYVDYQKFLMMVTEGYSYTEMGFKNSYFLAEAYAIGKIPLMLASPVIVAFVTAFCMYFLIKFFGKIYGKEFCYFAIPLCFLSNSLTSGFSSFLLFKGLILQVLQLSLIALFFLVFKTLLGSPPVKWKQRSQYAITVVYQPKHNRSVHSSWSGNATTNNKRRWRSQMQP